VRNEKADEVRAIGDRQDMQSLRFAGKPLSACFPGASPMGNALGE
jgi:hypothetical protein